MRMRRTSLQATEVNTGVLQLPHPINCTQSVATVVAVAYGVYLIIIIYLPNAFVYAAMRALNSGRQNAYSHASARGDNRSIDRSFDAKLIETFDACIYVVHRQLLEQYLQIIVVQQLGIHLVIGRISCDSYYLSYNMRLHLYNIVLGNITAFLYYSNIHHRYRHREFIIFVYVRFRCTLFFVFFSVSDSNVLQKKRA